MEMFCSFPVRWLFFHHGVFATYPDSSVKVANPLLEHKTGIPCDEGRPEYTYILQENRSGSCGFQLKHVGLIHRKSGRMIRAFLRNPAMRLLISALMSFPLRLLLDLAFSLTYRYYSILRPATDYLVAMALTVAVIEAIRFSKLKLNSGIPWENGPVRRLLLEILINGAVLIPLMLAIRFAGGYLFGSTDFIRLSDETLTILFYAFFLIVVPAFLEFTWFLVKRWQLSLAETERYRKESAEFRFESLRSQINPHFLFNSLNTLSGLVYEDPDKASDFIRHLSDVYRYVLENRSRETIGLADEMQFIRAFLHLYQLRFDQRLKIKLEVGSRAMERKIAPMTLQLLVENAVKHNIVSAKKPLSIRIEDEDGEWLVVSNNLQKKAEPQESHEMGLKNISGRYAYLTGKPVIIEETSEAFTVKIPLI
jgi:sensor histidine kinase YesM